MGIRVDSENHISSIVPGSVAADEGRIAVGDKIITVRRVVTLHTLCQIWRETVSLVFPRVLMFPSTSSREIKHQDSRKNKTNWFPKGPDIKSFVIFLYFQFNVFQQQQKNTL